MAEKDKIRLSLEVSTELNELLESLASYIGGTKSEVLRRSIALMELAVETKKKKHMLGVVDECGQLITRIIGI